MKKYLFALLGIEVILFLLNFRSGTYLIGWDNVMPEWNLPLNFSRSFFSIWQEYRGLGLPDGMAHAANLLHTLYIAIFSVFLPENILRYIYIHLTHLAGGIGLFFLARRLTKNELASLFAALFYQFNIGVIQMYYAPLEVFATHFAALPWIALTMFNALSQPNRKNLLLLFLISLLLSPQGFVPTVFIVFLAFFATLLLFHVIFTKQFKRALLIAAIVLLANAFWMVPYLYSGAKMSKVIPNTRINEFSSEEIFYRNKSYGDLASVISLKGFMIDTVEYEQSSHKNFFFMYVWRTYTSSLWYQIGYISLVLTALLGVIFSIKERRKGMYPFLLAGGVGLLFLANSTPLLEQINLLIRGTLPVVGEVLRFPFTKFITLFAFCISLLLATGLAVIFEYAKKYMYVVAGVVFLALAVISYPAFRGNFTSPALRLEVPTSYNQAIEYFKNQNHNTRIALFPVQTFWNWQYTSWGLRGSGFIWHGIPQPILMRSFDPWSLANEQFYNELAYAVNNNDIQLFDRVLQKYDVSYILFDSSIINTLSNQPLNVEAMNAFLSSSQLIRKDAQFDNITIYKTTKPVSFVARIDPSLPKIHGSFVSNSQDPLYTVRGNYLATEKNPDIISPLSSLSTLKLQEDNGFEITSTSSTITITKKYPTALDISSMQLSLPSLTQHEFLIPVRIERGDEDILLTPLYPQILVNGRLVSSESAEPIRITPHITDVRYITLGDTEQKIDLNSQNRDGYILNSALNSVILENEDTQENILIDSSLFSSDTRIIDIPQQQLQNFSVVLPKIHSNLSMNDIVKNNAYKVIRRNNDFLPFDHRFNTASNANGVKLTAKGGYNDLTFYNDALYHEASYILLIDATYHTGLPISFYLDNTFQNRAEYETRLSKKNKLNTIILPKSENYFKGYGFHLTAKSVGKEEASSTISTIELYPLPQTTLSQIQFVKKNIRIPATTTKIPQAFDKLANFSYSTPTTGKTVLTLSQSYDSGWSAYVMGNTSHQPGILARILPFAFGKKIAEHILVNNWSNGWIISNTNATSHVVIIYWPQYLQFTGLFFTIITPLCIVLWKNRRRGNK